jgi:hypothetical protein
LAHLSGDYAQASGINGGEKALILMVGPELPQHGPDVLSQGAARIKKKFGEENVQYASHEEIRAGKPLPQAGEHDTVYLVGHGDDPGHPDVTKPRLGDQTASSLVGIVGRALQDRKKNGPFKGTIVLGGCHTAVPKYEGNKITGKSALDDFQGALKKSPVRKQLAPEATIAGYHGPAFDSDHRKFDTAEVESPAVAQKLGVKTGTLLKGEDAVLERRAGQGPAF